MHAGSLPAAVLPKRDFIFKEDLQMTQLDNLKKQIQELEETCDAARDRIKNEKISFLSIYENRASFFINKIEVVNVSALGIRFYIIFEDEKELAITVSDYIENIAF